MDYLSDLQQDVLTEAINLGIGNAAASLSEMVNEVVTLSVPVLSFLDKQEAINKIQLSANENVSGVSQNFEGPFSGEALLLFPISKSLELVRLMLQDTVEHDMLTEFEEEALNEIGNIILNSGLSSLADVFGEQINSSLPIFRQGTCNEVMNSKVKQEKEIVLFLRVDFNIESYQVDGYVVFLLDVNSITDLIRHIDKYLEAIGA